MRSFLRLVSGFLCLVASSQAAITLTAPADKSYQVNNTTTITVTADTAAGSTTTATLDGVPFPVGVATVVNSFGYHELKAESRNAGGTTLDSQLRRFIIVLSPERGNTENGIPPHTPYKTVNDAPSAFAGGTFKIIAPTAWPVGFPVPMAAKLLNGANETLRLSGLVTFGGFPGTTLQLRRGWGSVVAPAVTNAGTVNVNAVLNSLTANPSIAMQNMTFTDVSGTISANTNWPANSRMRITSTLTIAAGATLTIGEGTIVLLSTGTATNGSAAEISVSGTLQCNGAEGNPIVFAPATAGLNWGGIELPVATSRVDANWTIFTGAGEDENWTANSTIDGPSHQSEQPVFAIAGSGSGTAIGAQLHLTDCFSFEHAGQQMNSRTNTWIDLKRTLYQRCITSGEMNGSKVTVDRSALIEFPSETGNFVDDDNDALYMTNGDLSVTNSVIGFTKDDGVDSGGDGGNSPFGTINPATGNTITRYDSTNNWYEGTYHEGNSLSGTRYVYFTGCVFYNCGQGIEAGYSAGAGDGPNALVDGCLFVGNMVALRWGDNYQMASYNGRLESKNSIVIHSLYHDLFSYDWQTNLANSWTYQTTDLTTGRQYFNIHDNFISQPDTVHHPANTAWNGANPAHASMLAAFMPVPNSNVGVAISSYAPVQGDIASYPGTFTVRLSTFSSKPVTLDWAVLAKIDPFASNETTIGSGSLAFAPGETLKTINAPILSGQLANYGLIHVALFNPVNAEVTGEAWYFKPATSAEPNLVARGGSGWVYRQTPSDPQADWKVLSAPLNAEWLSNGVQPFGFAYTVNTTLTRGPDNNVTRTFYFRKTFNVPEPSLVTGLTFRVRRDDGVLAWLNNNATPIANSTDGAALPTNATYATLAPNATNTGTYFSYTLSPSLLVKGDNILAVECHQSGANSSDLFMDCELVATYNVPLQLFYTESNGDPVLWWYNSSDVLEHSFDLLNWIPAPVSGSPVSVDPSAAREFFRLRR